MELRKWFIFELGSCDFYGIVYIIIIIIIIIIRQLICT
jgi:hypothetical protein